ncbi:VWD domain-containing protein, partial [Salmonella sp. S146_54837]|uniref:VWD domain-containing protein n=1 Tax=Salmonella sp. S146_54837 TaxID=2665635 RepID=UPI0016592869
ELPFAASENIAITRDSSSIFITSSRGFKISYDLHHDILKVQLSIFYFGKTAGLFGDFNHEPNDDFTKSSGAVTGPDHVDEFSRSWEIGKKCETKLDKSVTCDDTPYLLENLQCAVMFLDGLGPASAGHPAVDPEPFYKACVNSVCGNFSEKKLQDKRCSVFQAYIDTCKHEGLG